MWPGPDAPCLDAGTQTDVAAAEARARAEMFQKGLASTLWTAKRHIDPAKWRALMDDLRRECEPFAPGIPRLPGAAKAPREGHLNTEKMLGPWVMLR